MTDPKENETVIEKFPADEAEVTEIQPELEPAKEVEVEVNDKDDSPHPSRVGVLKGEAAALVRETEEKGKEAESHPQPDTDSSLVPELEADKAE